MLAALQELPMCMLCELQLFNDHQALEREFYNVCPKCKKFPADASGHECYHCFSVGGIVDECRSAMASRGAKSFYQPGRKLRATKKTLPF